MSAPGTNETSTSPALRPTSLLEDGPEVPPHDPIMDDLYGVGPDKPMGYLPISTIYGRNETPDRVAALSVARGLSTFWQEPRRDRPPISAIDAYGALYVYDELALGHLLKQSAEILGRSDWPQDPRSFVERVAGPIIDAKRQPRLRSVIDEAFNDKGSVPRPSGRIQRVSSFLLRK